jgi:hypothetical protein
MSIIPQSAHDDDPVSGYVAALNEASNELDEKLSNIRRDLDAGDISMREASDERILVMSEHLSRLIRLRIEHFGSDR